MRHRRMGAIVTGALLLIAAPGALASGCGSESGGPTGFSPAASPTWSSTTTTPTETATAGPTSSPGDPDAAALFAQQSQLHPAELRNMVTSPGGTTAEALYQLEKGGVRTVLSRAVWAAYQKTRILGGEEDK